MSIVRTLGGNRLGSGNGMKVALHNFERSTHDLSRIWRSSMTCGTLVPFMVEPALNGDTFDINLTALAKTIPTISPLFGSFKFQADVFFVPMRLYIKELHNNKMGIGMDMKNVKLPIVSGGIKKYAATNEETGEVIQYNGINSSSLLSYLGKNGTFSLRPISSSQENKTFSEDQAISMMAIPYLGYFDIYKNYYANQQEISGYMITPGEYSTFEVLEKMTGTYQGGTAGSPVTKNLTTQTISFSELKVIAQDNKNLNVNWDIKIITAQSHEDKNKITFEMNDKSYSFDEAVQEYQIETGHFLIKKLKWLDSENTLMLGSYNFKVKYDTSSTEEWQISDFNLKDLDVVREKLLTLSAMNAPVRIQANDNTWPEVIRWPFSTTSAAGNAKMASQIPMGGLLLKTYQSDIFNNYLNAEQLQTEGGINYINEATKVSTADGGFTIDSLILAKKVYNMLNRIAVSGGSYRDWQESVYGERTFGHTETPIYCGSMSNEIVFDEVVATASNDNAPLGSLAGRGTFKGMKHNKIIVKPEEPGFLLGICSITPRIDYYQGDKWFCDLNSVGDLHAPSLDCIGFQDLLIKRFFAEDNTNFIDPDGDLANSRENKAIGKQPAWIDYMTSFNEVHGDFTDDNKAGSMVLKRDYKWGEYSTYINPTDYNKAFADTSLGAQNFWIQIGIDCKARRKMSAKIMPNL